MKLTYYGVRGSIPTPGEETIRYGGNTSCALVEAGNNIIILDAGTGIRKLGNELMRREFGKGKGKAHIFLSHYHWDHIQGLPFFVPAYIPGNQLNLHGEERLGRSIEEIVEKQQAPPNFPEDARFQAKMNFHTLKEWETMELSDKVKITCARLNHSSGVTAYRIENPEGTIVYATDTEHYAVPDWKLAKLAAGADLLVYDGQYTPEEYPQKQKWGHSTYEEGAKIAKLAGVRELHLFHHDPMHDDATIDAIVEKAQRLFPKTKGAREGMVVTVGKPNTRSIAREIVQELRGLSEEEQRAKYDVLAKEIDPKLREAYWEEIKEAAAQ